MYDTHPKPKAVIAVIVAYRSDLKALASLLDRLKRQVHRIILVDNGSNGGVEDLIAEDGLGHIVRIDPGENIGVAAAINRGAKLALEFGATHLLLSDQDSFPSSGMVDSLLAVCDTLQARGVRVAAVGPHYIDRRAGRSAAFVRTQGVRLKKITRHTGISVVEVDFLITSGSLIPAASWLAIGGMEEKLFIDYVDIEWGLRARFLGYLSYGTFECEMDHSLGDRRLNFFGQSVPVHTPLRHYYQVRNPVWMYSQPWIPLNWKIVDAVRLLLRFAFYSLITSPRRENIQFMMRGFVDGIRGRLGRLDV